LNDKSKKLRRAPLYTASMAAFDEDSDDITNDEPATATATKSRQISLIWTQPIVAPVPEREQLSDEEPPEDDESDDEATDWAAEQAQSSVVNEQTPLPVTQLIAEEPSSNVTAVEPDSTGANIDASLKAADGPAAVKKGKKRVRIVAPHDPSSRKRTRITPVTSTTAQDSESIYQSSTDDARSASETEEESEGSDNAVHSNTKKRRVRNFKGRQRGKPGPPPTLLERLTGLTGDPDDPIYQPPQRAPRPGRSHRSWNERKRARTNRFKKEQQYAQVSDSLDDFKKLFYTFIVVSSLSGEDGQIDWSLFKQIYDGDRFFDTKRAQMLWGWMQTHMSEQVCELTRTFQSLYLEAYETGKVAAIDTPETHDWAGLVRWAMRKCAYPDLPLPVFRQALQQFTVEESNYEILDRVLWYKAATADRTRTMLQLQQSFTAPLHRSRKATWSPDDQLLKARSWVRANTATPQALYDANLAHDKFKNIGETVLVNVVGDLVDKQHLRMRKLKRLLPGRNYNFTQALAKKYARLFQLDDFMNAVEVKKKMDAAFADDDPELRHYNMSRCEEDGAFAAIMTMVNEGTVKLAPQLPPVNNEFDASLPKLSVWGFCEGGYNHRAIDRGRLFWDIHVVPTENYRFGNPLQPLSMPPSTMDDDEPAVWPALPEPPLPGKHDSGALLPIWSSIDGQSVTWPWWYRVLNLVLQPLIFLAGATAADIHSHCPEHTTELFEIELILDWLESIKAVTRTVGGGYITLPGFWAAFGDQLRDTEDDWFGEHVKRKAKNHEKQRWRVDYALRHSTLQARKAAGADAAPPEEEGDANVPEVGAVETRTSREILKNPKQQYRIMQQALHSEQSHAEENRSDTRPASGFATPQTEQGPALNATGSKSHTPEATSTPSADVEMADADVDAEGEEDVDAEGEIDDGMY
jgi:transcription factor C subunit 3